MTTCMPPEYRMGTVTETWRSPDGAEYTIDYAGVDDPVETGAHGSVSRRDDCLVSAVVRASGLPDLDLCAAEAA